MQEFSQVKTGEKKNPLLPVVFVMGAIILGLQKWLDVNEINR